MSRLLSSLRSRLTASTPVDAVVVRENRLQLSVHFPSRTLPVWASLFLRNIKSFDPSVQTTCGLYTEPGSTPKNMPTDTYIHLLQRCFSSSFSLPVVLLVCRSCPQKLLFQCDVEPTRRGSVRCRKKEGAIRDRRGPLHNAGKTKQRDTMRLWVRVSAKVSLFLET